MEGKGGTLSSDDTIDDGKKDDTDEEGGKEEEETGVSPARWWVLAIFSLLGMVQCMLWNTWGPVIGIFIPCGPFSKYVQRAWNWKNIHSFFCKQFNPSNAQVSQVAKAVYPSWTDATIALLANWGNITCLLGLVSIKNMTW